LQYAHSQDLYRLRVTNFVVERKKILEWEPQIRLEEKLRRMLQANETEYRSA